MMLRYLYSFELYKKRNKKGIIDSGRARLVLICFFPSFINYQSTWESRMLFPSIMDKFQYKDYRIWM